MKPCLIALATCICLVFVCSVLATAKSRGDSSIQTLQQAAAPYIDAMGRDPDEVHPGSQETVLLWGQYDPIVVVARRFEKTGWQVVAFYRDQKQTVPSEWQLMWALAWRAYRDREQPTDPWGNVITDLDVLYPETRW